MGNRLWRPALLVLWTIWTLAAASVAWAAPYAAFVIDARTGAVLHSENAETPLHPASLTKMMTLYVAFQAIQRGEITLDTEVRIPADAADEPPSRLGLREGQIIRLRYLLRAAAVKSANDAATAIGYAISGSEEEFAARMNATAAAMGMTGTHFLNMNGLTQDGHYSTARDMTILGRHLVYDFPQYYGLFSRRVADAGIHQVVNTNSRFLDQYEGADGIKTGYTVAAGYNLTASAERGEVRIIATVFGATSVADRTRRISDLLDIGFESAPAHAQVAMAALDPSAVSQVQDVTTVAAQIAASFEGTGGGPAVARTIRVSGSVPSAIRPLARGQAQPGMDAAVLAALEANGAEAAIADALAEALGMPEPEGDAPDVAVEAPPAEIIMTAAEIAPEAAPLIAEAPEVVARVSTNGGGHWGVHLGNFNSRDAAERALLQAAVAEAGVLEGGVRRVLQQNGGYDANIVGLSQEAADQACRRLAARGTTCFMLGTDAG